MQEYMEFQVLFDGYFKDLYSFYEIAPDIDVGDSGIASFDKITIVYENFLDENTVKPTMENCQLEFNTSEEFHAVEEKLLNTKSTIIDKAPYSEPRYILTEDPAGLKVKINFSNKKSAPIFKIPYSGKVKNIDTFYNALGIDCKRGIIELDGFTINYYSHKEKTQIMSDDFELMLFPDEEASALKKLIKENGGTILSHENTIMGELMVAQDPANLVILFFLESSSNMFG